MNHQSNRRTRDWRLHALVAAARGAIVWGRDPDEAIRIRAAEMGASADLIEAARRFIRGGRNA